MFKLIVFMVVVWNFGLLVMPIELEGSEQISVLDYNEFRQRKFVYSCNDSIIVAHHDRHQHSYCDHVCNSEEGSDCTDGVCICNCEKPQVEVGPNLCPPNPLDPMDDDIDIKIIESQCNEKCQRKNRSSSICGELSPLYLDENQIVAKICRCVEEECYDIKPPCISTITETATRTETIVSTKTHLVTETETKIVPTPVIHISTATASVTVTHTIPALPSKEVYVDVKFTTLSEVILSKFQSLLDYLCEFYFH